MEGLGDELMPFFKKVTFILITRVWVGYDPSQNAENPIKAEDRKHPQINEDVTATTMFLCAMASMVI